MKSKDFSFNSDDGAALLSVMANSKRLQIFFRLIDREWDVAALATALKLSQPALSQHLRKMRQLKVVKTRRDGATIYYRCDSRKVMLLLATLDGLFKDSSDLLVA